MTALIVVVAAVLVIVVGYVAYRLGSRGIHRDTEMKHLEEYDFYPFVANEDRHIEFDPDRFKAAVDYFTSHRNSLAAGELIVIGEQNFIRDTFPTDDLQRYRRLYEAYDGDSVIRDNAAFLENYKRIVRLVGRSFPNTGFEILLHDLVNPSKSVVAIEGGEVTGRTLENGTTNLVLDLKTRRLQQQDKLNYELNIGARRFKCTTIPIFRPEYGLVGAICINIDERFLREEVMGNAKKVEAFFDNFLKTDFELEENILSVEEYKAAINGKRHYLDEAIRETSLESEKRRLAAIMFSDIVGYTKLMERDEAAAIDTLTRNSRVHREAIARHGGRLLKELGDGVLASFDSVSNAVACAREIQAKVAADNGYQIRIGIHLGEVIHSGRDVFGDGVNIASRIEGVAEPGTIVVSDAVFNNVKNQTDIVVTDLGERELKHIAEPVRLYAINT